MAREIGRYDPELGKVVWYDAETYQPKGAAHIEIIEDSLPPGGMWHPATGQYVHSKSLFRKITKAAGCIEVGNEKQVDRRQWGVPNAKQDVLDTIERLKAR